MVGYCAFEESAQQIRKKRMANWVMVVFTCNRKGFTKLNFVLITTIKSG
jgi:hypothetical protein